MSACTGSKIEEILRSAFAPLHLSLADESEAHRGHAGARGGGGHFRVLLVSSSFAGMSQIERHRAVYEALEDMMGHAIHALSIKALSPDEWKK